MFNKKSNNKGQLFTLDLALSFTIFIVVIAFIFSFWNFYLVRLNDSIIEEELQILAFQVSDILIETEGFPIDWENDPSNVEVIGLSSGSVNLDNNKMSAFLNHSYNDTKKSFGITRFDLFLNLANSTAGNITQYGEAPSNDSKKVVTIIRQTVYQGQDTIMEVTLWQ